MPIDPRTPVLIGYGQVNQHDDHPGVEPVDLMVAAARAAADPRVLESVDSVRIVNMLSWRYRDPGLLLAQRIRANDATTRYTGVGGNVPQSLVNQACLDIQAGRAGVVLIAGAETPASPSAVAPPRRQARLDQSGRVGPDRRGRGRRCADGRTCRATDQTGSARVCLSDVRAGGADRRGGAVGYAPSPHRRTVGAIQRGRGGETARLAAGPHVQ